MIKNHKIAVKCFKNKDEAEKEKDILEEIRKVA